MTQSPNVKDEWMQEGGASPLATGLSSQATEPKVSALRASIPSAVIAELAAEFGPGNTNGVAAIMLHPDLPKTFDKKAWRDWFFKPSDAAFEWAQSRGLIEPWKQTKKWALTPLGVAVADLMQRIIERDEA